MAETLSNLSTILLISAGIFLALAVFFWFYFKIPHVIGYLTGKTAREDAARLRASAAPAKAAKAKNTHMMESRVGLTEALPQENPEESRGTGILSENRAEELESEATGLLDDTRSGGNESEATGLLDEQADVQNETAQPYRGMKLVMLDEVMLIHTDEVIE